MPAGEHKMPSPSSEAAVINQLTVTPSAKLEPGEAVDLLLELTDAAGKRVTELEVTHEKLLHLIVVSDDLSLFQHVHPEQEPDGRLRLAGFELPRPGGYVLFGDHTPTGRSQQVSRATLTVPGPAAAPIPLKAVALPTTATFGKFTVKLGTSVPPVAGGDVILQFEVREGGQPVTDFRNYLGARGHCVGIHEGADQFLHSHPLGAGAAGQVDFHTVFPVAGRYHVWAEFRPNGETLLTDFVIEVPAGAAAGSGNGSGSGNSATGHEKHPH
jgi:hypothetical protein